MSSVRLNEDSNVKEKLMALINTINGNLNNYLNYYRTYLVNQKKYSTNLPYKDKFVGFVLNESDNSELTGKRILNFLELRDKLIETLSSLDGELKEAKDINEVQLNTLKKMEDLVIKSKTVNQTLSSNYGKDHRSYLDNRNMGYGVMYSWWNKSWTQSSANIALEYSLSAIQDFATANKVEKPRQSKSA